MKTSWLLLLVWCATSYASRQSMLPVISVTGNDRLSTPTRADSKTTISCRNLSSTIQHLAISRDLTNMDVFLYILNASGVSGYTQQGYWYRAYQVPPPAGASNTINMTLQAQGSVGDSDVRNFDFFCTPTRSGVDCTPGTYDLGIKVEQTNGLYKCGSVSNCLAQILAAVRTSLKVIVSEDRGAVLCSAAFTLIFASSDQDNPGLTDVHFNGGRPF